MIISRPAVFRFMSYGRPVFSSPPQPFVVFSLYRSDSDAISRSSATSILDAISRSSAILAPIPSDSVGARLIQEYGATPHRNGKKWLYRGESVLNYTLKCKSIFDAISRSSSFFKNFHIGDKF